MLQGFFKWQLNKYNPPPRKLTLIYTSALNHSQSAADRKSEIPSRATVGAMVRGPTNRNKKPIAPVKPNIISRLDATISSLESSEEKNHV